MVDEFLALAYYREKGTGCRFFGLLTRSVPTPTRQYSMVKSHFIHQALRNEPITVYGDGNQSRCFCDVSDVIRAFVGLAKNLMRLGQVYNVGNTGEVRICGLARRVIALTGSRVQNSLYSLTRKPAQLGLKICGGKYRYQSGRGVAQVATANTCGWNHPANNSMNEPPRANMLNQG